MPSQKAQRIIALLAGIAATDFALERSIQSAYPSESRPIDNAEVATQSLSVSLQESAQAHPIFLAFGIEFFQIVNGQRYELNNTDHNAFAVVAVNAGR